jgi:hypothetical protein
MNAKICKIQEFGTTFFLFFLSVEKSTVAEGWLVGLLVHELLFKYIKTFADFCVIFNGFFEFKTFCDCQ